MLMGPQDKMEEHVLNKLPHRKEQPALSVHPGLENLIELKFVLPRILRGFVLEPLTISLEGLVELMTREQRVNLDEWVDYDDLDPTRSYELGRAMFLPGPRLPLDFVRKTVKGILQGLSYLHDEMNLIYAGEPESRFRVVRPGS